MLHRGEVRAYRQGIQETSYAAAPGVTNTFTWDPRVHGGRLSVNLSAITHTTAPSILRLLLEPTYVPVSGDELELVYSSYGGGPITVDASGTGGLCPSSSSGDPDLTAGLVNELLVLRYVGTRFRMVARRGLYYDWNTLNIIDSMAARSPVNCVLGGTPARLFSPRAIARMDAAYGTGYRALVGGATTDYAGATPRFALFFCDGANFFDEATVPALAADSSITSVHMYSTTHGLAGVSSSPSSVSNRVLLTSDGGDTWVSSGNMPTAVSSISGVVGGYNNTTRMLIAYVDNTQIFVSGDNGATWATESLPLGTDRLSAITHRNATGAQFIAVGRDASSDCGCIWRRSVASAGSGVWSVVNLDATTGTNLEAVDYDMAVGSLGRVWFTPDGGATWVQRPALEMGGTEVHCKGVVRHLVSGRFVYYVYYRGGAVGHLGLSLNAGQAFYGCGPYEVGLSDNMALGVLGSKLEDGRVAVVNPIVTLQRQLTVFGALSAIGRTRLQ